ncbi:hypothetical protein [Streptomyces sp. HB132]|uniref:hypothetical protein n=1 Tax=Streptomyces sp. HB132 TaxID=767388 RepID=UPI001D65034D|nr:hypothetical protein [Streptomyces sp. HB132]MBM7440261.1 hypothetical protein [Streptomyces sp. HB132]
MEQSRRAVNRITLASVGLALAVGGALLAGTEASIAGRLPGWWPDVPYESPLVDRAYLSGLRAFAWWTPAVVAATTLLSLLLARWFVSQCGGTGPHRLRLPTPGGFLHVDALSDALARRTAAVDGVARCRVGIRAHRTRLYVHTRIWLHPGVEPAAVLPTLAAVLTEAEASAQPYSVVGRTRISAASPGTARVR